MIDIRPSADRMATLLRAVSEDELDAPTPCPDFRTGDLIDHVGSLTLAFLAAAHQEDGERSAAPPRPSAANLGAGWRDRISRDLEALAEAWRTPAAWEGTTTAGGIEMPAEVAGLVVLDELLVHGWDIAVASGQPYVATPQEIDAATTFVSTFDAPRDGNLFGPAVPVPDTATPLDRLIGLTGRDPRWRPPS